MSKKKPSKKDAAQPAAPSAGRYLSGLLVERMKRVNSLPVHTLDWRTEYFLNHFLGGRKRFF